MNPKRNEIWLADLGERAGSVQAGVRPVVILQNNMGNKYSTTIIVSPITEAKAMHIPTHVFIDQGDYGIAKDSAIILEQIHTINKDKLIKRYGQLCKEHAAQVNYALGVSLDVRV